jgi:hypothetical protein
MARVSQRHLAWALVISAIGASGCSDATSSRPLPTLLVTNATCDVGRCSTLELRAFVWKFTFPQLVWGFELVSYVPPGRTCLTFPASWKLRVIGPDNTGRVDTTTFSWSPLDKTPIFLIALDSTFFHTSLDSAQADSVYRGTWPFDGIAPGSVGETADFAPADAPGWSVTFPTRGAPNRNEGGAPIATGESCKP